MIKDARIRLRYLRQTISLLYPGPGDERAYSLLPHAVLPRRLAPRRWWHAVLGPKVTLAAEGSIESYLSEVFGTSIRVVMHVRPAKRANRKPILEAYDGAQRVAFVKIGETSYTRELVAHEAATLARLADLPLKTVVTPSVLHHGSWHDHEVLVLSPLPIRRAPVGGDLLAAAVKEIAGTGPGAWHGDLSPWNIAPTGDGRLLVWDWERYALGVPLGFDALHHLFNRCLRRMDPATAARACLAQAPGALEPFGLSVAEAKQAAIGYLIALADRHAADGHEPLGPPERWLNPLVDHQELFV
ncbi:hypothetical protein ACIBH1_40210 [Nonomuraea sp. NPDC050663]|uniref:hypothetical protein n=1 Tax=Nonomuraea sp. NPDC050663 TaxID=3364370 RepID=UPI00379D62FC